MQHHCPMVSSAMQQMCCITYPVTSNRKAREVAARRRKAGCCLIDTFLYDLTRKSKIKILSI